MASCNSCNDLFTMFQYISELLIKLVTLHRVLVVEYNGPSSYDFNLFQCWHCKAKMSYGGVWKPIVNMGYW